MYRLAHPTVCWVEAHGDDYGDDDDDDAQDDDCPLSFTDNLHAQHVCGGAYGPVGFPHGFQFHWAVRQWLLEMSADYGGPANR